MAANAAKDARKDQQEVSAKNAEDNGKNIVEDIVFPHGVTAVDDA